jgi:hypothetical protein
MKSAPFFNQRSGSIYPMTQRHVREEILLSYTTGITSKLFHDVANFFIQQSMNGQKSIVIFARHVKWYIAFTHKVILRAVPWSVIRRPLTVDVQDQCQASPCGDFWCIKGTVDCFSLVLKSFSVSITTPTFNNQLFIYHRDFIILTANGC